MPPPEEHWRSLTREQLDALITEGLADADDTVRAAWERIRITPEKWRCSPWGDLGGGFWAVATFDDSVVWFNDIEDGFNVSSFSTRGVIGAYAGNQASFAEILGSLPEAAAAEQFAEQRPASSLPEALTGPGYVERRQTTYWELKTAMGARWRVHFSGKREARFTRADYEVVELVHTHPVLLDCTSIWAALYVGGHVADPAGTLEAVERRIAVVTEGWRSLAHYGQAPMRQRRVLETGYGLLLRAPPVVAAAAQAALTERNVPTSMLSERHHAQEECRALLLGPDNFVVAQAFRFEPL